MNRLYFSGSGFIRAIQISSYNIFVYCEGKRHDRYFYSEILSAIGLDSSSYQIKTAQEETPTGGKRGVINIFSFAKENKILKSNFKGKAILCLFFLDKDADCVTRQKLRSRHIIYTTTYDVEAHIFRDGNLKKAVAMSLGVPTSEVPSRYGDATLWCEHLANKWKEWLVLCVFSQKHKVSCGCGFGQPSQVHLLPNFNLEAQLYDEYKKKLRSRLGWSASTFKKNFASVELQVNLLAIGNNLFSIFKGKWIYNLIDTDLRAEFSGRDLDFNQLSSRISSSALSSLDFSAPWARHYRRRVADLVSK